MNERLTCDPNFKKLVKMKAMILGFPTIKSYTTWLYEEAERTKKSLGDLVNDKRKN